MNDFVNPKIQAMNLIRYIGDKVTETGESIDLFSPIRDISGSAGEIFAYQLVNELEERGIVKFASDSRTSDSCHFIDVNLTLDGWEEYEAEKSGQFDENYGFLAMEFGDGIFDEFVNSTLKPTVKTGTGFDLVDMRDVATAGIIDNILRIKIRNAKFVIVDLTHDNNGAYWEAGYAEGLGKPVIYICEKEKFDKKSTHFDTNHCTTIPWTKENGSESFQEQLVATIKRSLGDNYDEDS